MLGLLRFMAVRGDEAMPGQKTTPYGFNSGIQAKTQSVISYENETTTRLTRLSVRWFKGGRS